MFTGFNVIFNNINEFAGITLILYCNRTIMNQVFLSLGSNVGNRRANLKKAIDLLDPGKHSEIKESFIYITEPWGYREQRNFYNQVIEYSTLWEPFELLEEIHRIETACGRKHFKSAICSPADRH